MKNLLIVTLLSLLVIEILLYLSWSFYYTSINPSLWTEDGRSFFLIMGWVPIVLGIAILGSQYESKN